jgi:glutamyl-tRNA reductase
VAENQDVKMRARCPCYRMHRLLLLGLNHTTAPLEVRERLAFNTTQRRAAVEAFRQRFPRYEAVLLSTCNRVELYVGREAHGQPSVREMTEFLGSFHDVRPGDYYEHLYQKTGRDVVEHLFSVTSSLDSMVLGETQILGQVREAYDESCGVQTAGPLLNPLFQRAIAVGKQVMRETPIGEGRLSVASVAAEYAKQIFERFDDKTVLCVGAGKMSALVLQNLSDLSPRRVLVCNRDPSKADALAGRFGGQGVPLDRLADHLVAADIVVTSTGATQPIITRAMFEPLLKRRRYRPIFLIDIAVPRDVEAAVGKLDHVYLYNLDDLQQVVLGTLSQRKDAVEAARSIVTRQVEEFVLWHRQRELGPTIDRLYKHYHGLAQEELARTLNKLPGVSEAEKAHLEELTRRIVNKLLHAPIQTLRHSGAPHPSTAGPYLHALEKLFGLEGPTEAEPQSKPQPPTTPTHLDSHPGRDGAA